MPGRISTGNGARLDRRPGAAAGSRPQRPRRAPARRRRREQGAAARRARARRGRRGGAGQRAAHRAGRGAPGPPPRPRAAERRRAAPRPSGSRSTTPTAPSWSAKAELALQGARRRGNPADVEGAARPRHLPRQRGAGQGRLPLHRPGLAVREHAAPTCARREPIVADLVRRGRRDHGAAARGPARCRTSSSPTRPTRPPWRAPRRSCAAPRSPSRRC